MKPSKKLKNKNILNKLIIDTISDDMVWVYIGANEDNNNINYIFITFENIIGDKFLIFEIHLNTKIDLSKMRIYMQNTNKDDVIPIKNIEYSSKIKVLGYNILKDVEYDVNMDKKTLSDIKNKLIPIFKI